MSCKQDITGESSHSGCIYMAFSSMCPHVHGVRSLFLLKLDNLLILVASIWFLLVCDLTLITVTLTFMFNPFLECI